MSDLSLNRYYQEALDYINSNDIFSFTPGKYVIDDGNVWINVIEADLRPAKDAILEAHDEFIDIHIPFTATEGYGIRPRSACHEPKGEFDKTNDCILYCDKAEEIVTAHAGERTVFEPDTAHAPLIGQGRIRKAIVKVRYV